MADVRPLPGIRYAATENLAALVTPPYDVISAEAQERYYARDPAQHHPAGAWARRARRRQPEQQVHARGDALRRVASGGT